MSIPASRRELRARDQVRAVLDVSLACLETHPDDEDWLGNLTSLESELRRKLSLRSAHWLGKTANEQWAYTFCRSLLTAAIAEPSTHPDDLEWMLELSHLIIHLKRKHRR